jgi:glycosyltransferase involved in cell wall biosynthesis
MRRLKEAVRPYYLRWLYFPLRPGQRPQAFRDCWKYPFEKLSGHGRLPESLTDDKKRSSVPLTGQPVLLFYPMTDWHTRIQRTQHLVRAFARQGFCCIYVNPHLGREFETTPLFDPDHRRSHIEENIYELHVRLPREPVFHDRLLTREEEALVYSVIQQILPVGTPVIQMLSFPLWLDVARRFREEAGFPIVYDCHDLLSGFANIGREIISAEQELLRQADLVLFSAQGLMNQYGAGLKRAILVRNAVEAGLFRHDRPEDHRPQSHRPQKTMVCATVGYVGALDSWFDIEAVREAALAYPKCRFVLAGRIEYKPIRKLATLRNVEFLGETPYHRVPELLASFQVALIPFRITPLTLMTNPIKMYEYFSCGLPVVTTPLPEAQTMGDLVYLASTPPEFARQVGHALAEDDAGRRMRRREIAILENWDARARDISDEFQSLRRQAGQAARYKVNPQAD